MTVLAVYGQESDPEYDDCYQVYRVIEAYFGNLLPEHWEIAGEKLPIQAIPTNG